MTRFITLLFLLLCGPAGAQENDLQSRMVQAAHDMRAVESRLAILESTLTGLNEKRDGLEQEYAARRAKMAATLAALTRMGRTPREAVLIRPGGPLQAARTSMLLSNSVPAIETQAQGYRSLLEDLERTRSVLAEKTAQAAIARTDLKSRQSRLVSLMDARARNGGHATIGEAKAVEALARDARSLRDLLSALDGSGIGGGIGTARGGNVSMVPEGDGQLPVSGIVRIRYGQKDPAGGKSAGLSIETRAGSVVVAPLGGIVRYAGPFRVYGNIVIIAHKGGFHSLVAGLDKISVTAGQVIVSGEPIAILGEAQSTNQVGSSNRRTVYYELRQGGTPIDPARKLPDLG